MPVGQKSAWRVGPLPFGRSTLVRLIEEAILVADAGRPDVDYLQTNGARLKRFRLPPPTEASARPIVIAAREQAIASAQNDASREFARASYAAAMGQDALARWTSLLVTEDRHLWVGLGPAAPGGAERVLVIREDGVVLKRWALPPRGRLLSVGGGYALVAVPNEDDVERLLVVRLP